ncbi:hypothetical protein AAZX31_07G106400 [Glycine max]
MMREIFMCHHSRRFSMLTLRFHFAFLGYTVISHSCCIRVAWFCVSFLSREKKTWKTMPWCYCSMMAVTTWKLLMSPLLLILLLISPLATHKRTL